ncbi:hypothetical protein [Foetidibacter luteolus]|uniref:hypothetical protein n=1 Tax=Foetidibacter luteolus TaxID=2608880 RepID=UPI00129BED20|nr:hypothetical protein [Foetidibacter luteolus]
MTGTYDTFIIHYLCKPVEVSVYYISGAAGFTISVKGAPGFSIQRKLMPGGRKTWVGPANINSETVLNIGALIDKHLKTMSKPVRK